MNDELKEKVNQRYSDIARESSSCCSGSSCCSPSPVQQAKQVGYSREELKNVPGSAIMGLGCGNPTGLADFNRGEKVLDLGSGAGLDVFLAANKVGPNGKAIGVDMSEEMIKRAKKGAIDGGFDNVEFKVGEIEDLPVEDNSVDAVISNCVINLSPNKLKVFQEIHRVLKPRGRALISDLVSEVELPKDLKEDAEAWSECLGGVLQKEEYLDTIGSAGFDELEIIDQSKFADSQIDERLEGEITSLKVRAYR
ncbi:MAG: arsenite methyltransferase [Candidatus Bipolaricaulota bacterium]|nr:arsenite methyltransferase [Candidatus Bipolaricaulota bacterium]